MQYEECPQNAMPGSKGFTRMKGPILVSLATTAGSFAIGAVLSWTSVALSDSESSLRKDENIGGLTSEQESWIGSIVALGALVSGPLTGFSIDTWGRKLTLIGINIPLLLGWLLIVFASNPTLIILGRCFTGVGVGCLTLVIPVYITESSEERLRGAIASSFPILWAIGILFTNLSGMVNLSWFWLSIIYAIAPVVLAICMLFVPDTPTFYLRRGRENQARKSIKWLRSTDDWEANEELEKLNCSLKEGGNDGRIKLRDIMQRSVLKPSMISVTLFVFQQFSGFNAVVFYMVDIFEAAGSGMESTTSATIVGAINLVAVCITSALTDKLGRRLLVLVSETGITISLTALGIFFYLKKQNDNVTPDGISWLPLLSLIVFMVSFNFGMGPMPFLLMGEILPSHVKGLVSSVGISTMWFLTFLITKTFADMTVALGSYGCFWLFASVSAVGFFFALTFVKETKGKTFDQIQKLYA